MTWFATAREALEIIERLDALPASTRDELQEIPKRLRLEAVNWLEYEANRLETQGRAWRKEGAVAPGVPDRPRDEPPKAER